MRLLETFHSLFRRKSPAIILVSLLFLSVVGVLIAFNYFSLKDLQDSSFEQWKQQVQKRSLALSYFFSERFYDLNKIAHSPGIRHYYQNKALGMTKQYGMLASLREIKVYFRKLISTRKIAGSPIYKKIAFLDPEKTSLVQYPEKNAYNLPIQKILSALPDKPTGKTSVSVLDEPEKRYLLLCRKIRFKNRFAGYVLTTISVSTLIEQFLKHQDPSFPGFMLLSVHNRDLVNIQGMPPEVTERLQDFSPQETHQIAIRTNLLPEEIAPKQETPQLLDFRIFRLPLENGPFSLISARPEEYIYGKASPMLLLLVFAAVTIFILCITVIIIRVNSKNLVLQAQLEEGAKREKIVQEKNRELQEAKLEAESANTAKSRFLASMSHEIRTPLNAVLGLTQLAMNTQLNPTQHQYLQKIHSSSRSLHRIIEDILNFSKIEYGKLSIENIPFSLDFVLQRVADLCSHSAGQKGLRLVFPTEPKSPQHVKGDPNRLVQVLVNLVNNAIKFTEQGYIQVEIQPIARESGKVQLEFLVRDTGIGLDKEQLNKIFDSFSQAETSLSRRYGGLGLGLSISKQLVNMMGGEIGVESEVNRGSCFYFVLWFESVDASSEKQHALTAKHNLSEQSRGADNRGMEISGVRVLLVEDNQTNRELISEMLSEAGMQVIQATNGREALEILQAQSLDIVLMGVEIPEMDGLQATRWIRTKQDPNSESRDWDYLSLDPEIPVIAITAHASPEDMERCLNAGMDDYISKPFNLQEILELVGRWIGSSASVEREVDFRSQKVETEPDTELSGQSKLLAQTQRQRVRERLLQKYIREGSTLTEYLQAGEFEKALRWVHDTKTMATYTEEEALYKAAADLEQELRSATQSPSPDIVQNFQNAFRDTYQDLKQKCAHSQEDSGSHPINPDLDALAALLRKLAPEVEQNKPRACQPLVEELEQYSWPEPYNSRISELNNLIKKYKFKEAQEILKGSNLL